RRELKNSSVPEGTARLQGEAQFAQVAGQPALSGVTVNGTLASPEIVLPYQGNRIPIRGLGARYSLVRGNANVSGLRASLMGGALSADLLTRDLAGKASSQLTASLHGISITELQKVLVRSASNRVNVQGRVDLVANANWVKAFQELVATAD